MLLLTPAWEKAILVPGSPWAGADMGHGGGSPGRLIGFLVGVSFLLLGMAGE